MLIVYIEISVLSYQTKSPYNNTGARGYPENTQKREGETRSQGSLAFIKKTGKMKRRLASSYDGRAPDYMIGS